ncbi:MAG: PSD1 and planctomycete cytochrome C domain-containing protein [Rhodothermales bacterium]
MSDGSIKTKLPLVALLLFALIASGAYLVNRSSDDALPDVVAYNEHIRPILSTNCYVCHGPDISTREAGLRLDLRDSAIVALESGNFAIVPGKGSESEMISRVTSLDPEERMPPPELKKILSDHEVALLKKWIDQGAEWQEHWSLVPPEKPAVPRVRRTWQAENDIDRFIVAAMEQQKLSPANEANKEALIRRLSFVLTGLPPTPEGVRAFLEDDAPDAYEKLVDRLLDSPHYGERWARHWMDMVRFANTRGHEFDFPVIGANHYRDYLIRAFNADLPYDQLITEHLAGDLMETPRLHPGEGFNESALGTVFFGLGEGKHSPVDTQLEEYDRTDNIIDVTSKTFQGLTVACAKCHDHKFDPIPTTDYYALYGIIKSSRYAMRVANQTSEIEEQVVELKDMQTRFRDTLADTWLEQISEAATYAVELKQSEISLPENIDSVQVNSVQVNSTQVIGDFTSGDFTGWIPDGLAFDQMVAPGIPRFEGKESGELTALTPPRVSSAAVSSRLFGVLRSPDFELKHNFLTVRAVGKEARIRVIMDNFQLIQNPIYGELEAEVDTSALLDYTLDLRMWKGKKMYLEFLPAKFHRHEFVREDNAYIEAVYAVTHDEEKPVFFKETVDNGDISGVAARDAIVAWREGKGTAGDIALINGLLEAGVLTKAHPSMADTRENWVQAEQKLPAQEYYMGIIDGIGADHPVFIRGAMTTPSDSLVPRRGFTVHDKTQAAFETDGSGRMHFVQSLLDPDNPLTSRVMVNRLWHYVFGKGLVETVDNFGVQGKYPSHPELLDYLAIQFVEDGWSIKNMLRQMVLTKTFRRATVASSEAGERDPENIYLQHYPIRRLEAEAIRDAMLVTSGRFNPTMYGEDVPIHLTKFMEGRGRPAEVGPLDGDGRRSIYVSVRRNFLQPFMLVFDMPIPFTTFGKRNTSNVPAQSLTLLNDPFVLDQAEHWAQELISLKELGMEQKIAHIYLKAFARAPKPEEVEQALAFLEQQAATYALEAGEFLNDKRPWRDFCHTIFNMKEFIHLV